MVIIIRPETAMDVAAIKILTEVSFTNIQHSNHNEQCIIEALRKSGQLTISLVAEIEKAIVGHVAVSPVSISDGTEGWFGLGPIAVLPKFQQNGIGTKLMQSALKRMKALGAKGCVLLGDPAYYYRFGFRVEPDLLFPGVPVEYFQAISFSNKIPKGEVVYDECFYAQDEPKKNN